MQAPTRRYVLLALLTGILVFNFVDRFALGLVLEKIKNDLSLSDTQLGFLTGIAFALFYSVMGLPIARWADRGNRVTIISVTTALWSVAVALCGMAANYWQLLLGRIGVAVGEAGGFAPGLSLISDYFSRSERPRAMACYALGGPLSAIIGYLLGGWLSELYGWRGMFILLGVPGLTLAVVARFALIEPRCNSKGAKASVAAHVDETSGSTEPGIRHVFTTLWANRTFRNLLLCNAISFFFVYGILQWLPTYFVRSYAFSGSQLASLFATVYGGGGLLGTYLGGELASRFAVRNEVLQLKAVAVAMMLSGMLSVGIYVGTNPFLALAFLGITTMVQYSVNGPLYAVLQTVVPSRMRAVSVALVLFFSNLIGMGLGPLATGMLSDGLRAWGSEESLRYALLVLSPGYLWVGWHAWRASKSVASDIASVAAWDDPLDLALEQSGAAPTFPRSHRMF